MAQITQGWFEVDNPYNRQISIVPAQVDQVHSIVFWSKDYGLFLEQGYGKTLTDKGYHLFFNFTINSPNPLLEPAVRPLPQRLDQLARLSDRYGPQAIQWRFDPICHYIDALGQSDNNLDQFSMIADCAASLGITTCIASFVDLYRKVNQRTARMPNFFFWEPPLSEQIDIITGLAAYLKPKNIALHLCCEKALLAALPSDTGIQGAACISAQRLSDLFGPGLSFQRDKGQRTKAGCGCTLARDIGSYRLHPCRHNCLYCYANA